MYLELKDHLNTIKDRQLHNLLHYQETVVEDCIENAQRFASGKTEDINPCEGLYFSFEMYRALAHELQERNSKKSRFFNGDVSSKTDNALQDKTIQELARIQLESIESFKEDHPDIALEHYKELVERTIKHIDNQAA